ncbi:uncharacterized protein K02A2.6-like [Temnothorax curvispinosus]|uniref:RNA-directed DNA polymerase n=1 Tax=Temnothorax curvispinosus TaxID=300111 RepID=A0A6J1R7X0_9HYME|nr:uncharacterized protein K02A2.6-like [Temnothorax curvispinosus]
MSGNLDLQEGISTHVQFVFEQSPVSDTILSRLLNLQAEDPVCRELVKYIQNGWPCKDRISASVKPFYEFRNNLTLARGFIMFGNRFYIPTGLRRGTLEAIHNAHQGIEKCRARARYSVWWPKLSAELQQLVDSCAVCVQNRPARSEPLKPSNFPDRPWQIIAIDLFKHSTSWYLVVADFYSRYPEVYQLPDLRSITIIVRLKEIFARHGIPDLIRSDNGTQFDPLRTTEFRAFKKTYGFEHKTSSPHFPQSNGFIEAMVKTVKSDLEKSMDFNVWLLEYRTTPLKCGFSPSELAMGRRIKSFLPVIPSLLMPKTINRDTLLSKEKERMDRQKKDFDRRHHKSERDDLEVGDRVWIRDLRRWGVIQERAVQPRSYIIQSDTGTYRRNRSHLHCLEAPLGYFDTPENTPRREEWLTPPLRENSEHRRSRLHQL